LVFGLAGDERAASAALNEWTSQSAVEVKRERANVIGPVLALVSLARHDSATAMQSLEEAGTRTLTGIGGFAPLYVRGLSDLAANDNRAAVAVFQQILDHRGVQLASVCYPLSYLQQGRAYARLGDIAASRRAYEGFFALWKDADADLPALLDAKREYTNLR
jgi:eukaryotic-like serine/threonine-protein kinase